MTDYADTDCIPAVWTGPHVGLRLVEGYRTLGHLPGGRRGGYASLWPDYIHDLEDLLAQQSAADDEDQDADAANRTKVQPSAQEISRMESALGWPGTYLAKDDVMLARTVQRVAFLMSLEMDMMGMANRMKRPVSYLRPPACGGVRSKSSDARTVPLPSPRNGHL